MNCSYTISDTSKRRCPACQQFRDNFLRASLSHMLSRQKKEDDPCAANSHVNFRYLNFRYLNTPEKLQCMRNLIQLVRAKDEIISDLQKKVDSVLRADSVMVDESTHNDLLAIISAQKDVGSGENFSSIFWQQQLKAAKLKKKEWHALAPSHDQVVPLPTPLIKWLLLDIEEFRGDHFTIRKNPT